MLDKNKYKRNLSGVAEESELNSISSKRVSSLYVKGIYGSLNKKLSQY